MTEHLTDGMGKPVKVDWLYKGMYDLGKWYPNAKTLTETDSGVAFLFGELVKLATDKLRRYYSDLWHDAQVLDLWRVKETLVPGFQMYYALNEHGTYLSDNLQHVIWSQRDHLWRLTLHNEDGKWTVEIERGHLKG
jgi:hypothetical protein